MFPCADTWDLPGTRQFGKDIDAWGSGGAWHAWRFPLRFEKSREVSHAPGRATHVGCVREVATRELGSIGAWGGGTRVGAPVHAFTALGHCLFGPGTCFLGFRSAPPRMAHGRVSTCPVAAIMHLLPHPGKCGSLMAGAKNTCFPVDLRSTHARVIRRACCRAQTSLGGLMAGTSNTWCFVPARRRFPQEFRTFLAGIPGVCRRSPPASGAPRHNSDFTSAVMGGEF